MSRESELVQKYKAEPTETSSVSETELKRMLAAEAVPGESKPAGEAEAKKGEVLMKLLRGSMPPMPREEDKVKARTTPEYGDYIKEFDEKYGKGKPKQREVDEVTRKLDRRFQIMTEHNKELERYDCDILLYKNKIQKDLDDVMNDLREAYNIITILMNDRKLLQDLFAIFNIQIKGFNGLKKSLEDDLAARDKYIEKLKSSIDPLNHEIARLKDEIASLKKGYDEKSAELLSLKRQLQDAKSDANRFARVNEQQKDEIERLRKEVERLKDQLRGRTAELERFKAEAPALREEHKRLATVNDVLMDENERLKKEVQRLKDDLNPALKELGVLKGENKDLKAANANLIDQLKKFEAEIKALLSETKDLKPNNEKLTKQVEDLNNQNNDLMNECSGLKKKPQELVQEYEPKLAELKDLSNTLKEENEKLKRENDILKRDLNELIEERKKRNTERRKRKEDHMKKVVDAAHARLEDTKKKMEDKKNMIEATDLIKNALSTQDDLKKYPEMRVGTPETPVDLTRDEMFPQYKPMDSTAHQGIIDEVIDMRAHHPPGGTFEPTPGMPGLPGSQFFELTEPLSVERAPLKRIAQESDSTYQHGAPYGETFGYNDLQWDNDPACPYCHTTAEQPGYDSFQPHPDEEAWTARDVDRRNRQQIIDNARRFLERAKTDPRLRELFESQFPGIEFEKILDSNDFYDFALKLFDLMRKFNSGRMSDVDIRALLDKDLRRRFAMADVPPNKLSAKLQEGEVVNVWKEKYEDILTEALALIAPAVHARGDKSAEDAVADAVLANLAAIQEMFRKKKEPAPLNLEEQKSKEDDDSIQTPSAFTKAKLAGGVLPKIMQLLKSKQKEQVKEFRKVEQGTGKVQWTKTHFIFAIDGSGSMRGRRAKAVEAGFERCVSLLQTMTDIVVSSFTFDDKTTPHLKLVDPQAAVKSRTKMRLTMGEKTDYTVAIQAMINLIKDAEQAKPDYLNCLLFMSDGKGGYPEEQIQVLEKMKADGKKMLFITLACETEEEEDMTKMAKALQGEHYKVTDSEAMRNAFLKIISS
jgi:uncharacterized protein YegL/uncharacterized coiled-coil DUF342 family protein